MCSGIGFVHKAVSIGCDSSIAFFLAKNPAYHYKTKHIDVQYHFFREMVEHNPMLLEKIDTLKNVANSITKSVGTKKFSWWRESVGIVSLSR